MELAKTNTVLSLSKGFKQTEVGLIPSDWIVKELGEIGDFKNGINKNNEDFGFGLPFINLMDVFGKSSISFNDNFGLINSTEFDRKLYNLKKGDVLFIRSSVKPSGVGLTCVIENDLPNTVFSGFIIRFRDNLLLATSFKKHCFYSKNFRNSIIASSTVSANTNINQEALKKLILAFPPTLAEQTAIATALSDADAWINSLEKLIAKKRLLKQGAMQELLKPKEGWEVKSLSDVAEYKNGAAHENCVVENGDYIIVNSKFVSTEGKVKKYSNHNLCPVYKNEILMVLSDVPNGKAIAKCFYVEENNKYTLNQRICSLKSDKVDSKFLFLVLNRNPYYLQFDDGVKQTNLRNQDVLSCPIWLPESKLEQTRIASILSDMDAELDKLEEKLAKAKQVKQGMMQELLTGRIRLV